MSIILRTATTVLIPILALMFPNGSALALEPEVPSFARELPVIKSGEPVLQFNGKDLTGFYKYLQEHKHEDPHGVFTVTDGMIRVSGQEYGGFATKDEFRDYHLVVEWKWGDKTWAPRAKSARDSGILVHCVGPDGAHGGIWMQSQECQLIEGGTGDFIIVAGLEKPSLTCEVRLGEKNQLYFEKGAKPVTRDSARFNWWGRDPNWKDVVGFRGPRDVEKPVGEWNRMEIVCDGDAITTILNGYVVNAATGSSLTKGKIQFQSEGAELYFRKIEVRPLLR
jgi:Domain of Unknown Function (DUF1080)